MSIRQPYAELIPSTDSTSSPQAYSGQALRGIKTIEYRSRPTRIIGERLHVYAAKRKLPVVGFDKLTARSGQWSVQFADNIVVPTEKLPEWMTELAEQVRMIEPGALLRTGVIVGSAVIEKVSQVDARSTGSGQAMYRWHLADVTRAKTLRKPTGHPRPVWFTPF